MAQSNDAKLQAEAKLTHDLLTRLQAGLAAFNQKLEQSVILVETANSAKQTKPNTVQ